MDSSGGAKRAVSPSNDFIAKGYRSIDPKRMSKRIEDIESRLSSRIIGQNKAVEHVVRAFKKEKLRDLNLPFSVFLFAGPTGVGKTEMAKEIARWYLGDDEEAPLVFIDCTTFSEPHSVSALIGAPPGYVGSNDDTPLLANANLIKPFFKIMRKKNDHFKDDHDKMLYDLNSIRSQQVSGGLTNEKALKLELKKLSEFHKKWGPIKSVILFDEIEKAAPSVWRILLNILSDGKITLKSVGHEEVDFSNSIIALTTNIGSEELQKVINGKVAGFKDETSRSVNLDQDIYNSAKKAIETQFMPELIGRVKENLIVFRQLDESDYRKLIRLRMLDILKRCAKAGYPATLSITENFEKMLIEKGFDKKYGARVLNQKMEKYVVEPLAAAIESEQIKAGDRIVFDYQDVGDEKKEVKIFVKDKEFII